MEICKDKYIRKNFTALEHHLKAIQVEIIIIKGYNGHHNVEDMNAVIHTYGI